MDFSWKLVIVCSFFESNSVNKVFASLILVAQVGQYKALVGVETIMEIPNEQGPNNVQKSAVTALRNNTKS